MNNNVPDKKCLNDSSISCFSSIIAVEELLKAYSIKELAILNPQVLKNSKILMKSRYMNKQRLACKISLAAKCDLYNVYFNFAKQLDMKKTEKANKDNKVVSVKNQIINTRRGGYRIKKRRMIKSIKKTKKFLNNKKI